MESPSPVPPGALGEERLEDARQVRGGDAPSRVPDVDPYLPVDLAEEGPHPATPARRGQGVAEEVQEDLPHLVRVDLRLEPSVGAPSIGRRPRRAGRPRAARSSAGPAASSSQGRSTGAGGRAKTRKSVTSSSSRSDSRVRMPTSRCVVRIRALGEQLGRASHRGQWVADLVRQLGRERAQLGQPVRRGAAPARRGAGRSGPGRRPGAAPTGAQGRDGEPERAAAGGRGHGHLGSWPAGEERPHPGDELLDVRRGALRDRARESAAPPGSRR